MTAINRAEQLAISKSHDHDAENCNSSGNPSLNDIIEARMSRRGVFRAAVGTAGTAVLGSLALSACGQYTACFQSTARCAATCNRCAGFYGRRQKPA